MICERGRGSRECIFFFVMTIIILFVRLFFVFDVARGQGEGFIFVFVYEKCILAMIVKR